MRALATAGAVGDLIALKIVGKGLLKQTGKNSSCELGAVSPFTRRRWRRGKNLLPAENALSFFLNSIKLHGAIIALTMLCLSHFVTGNPILQGVDRQFA